MLVAESERLLTVDEVAERLGLGIETVRRYLRSGQLRGIMFGRKGGYRIRESDLEAFVQSRLRGGQQGPNNEPGQVDPDADQGV